MTTEKKTYSQKLLDPRWQKCRLKVLERDNFTCLACGDTTKTLHVHHGFYMPNTDPWDHHEDSLYTLCHECHEGEEHLKEFDKFSFTYLFSIGFLRVEVSKIVSHISKQMDNAENPRKEALSFLEHVKSWKVNG